VEPALVTTLNPARLIALEGMAPTVMSLPAGSIQLLPSVLMPYGMMSSLPVTGSTADTEVVLVFPRTRFCVVGTARVVPAIGLTGAVPVPSQPKLITPIGDRRVPPCVMVEAYTDRVPPAGEWQRPCGAALDGDRPRLNATARIVVVRKYAEIRECGWINLASLHDEVSSEAKSPVASDITSRRTEACAANSLE